ncbi:C-C motif chemokine 4-like [Fundulus heteroclitus]|uniref:C-C motif chemokine 4-like n=1 Tax=Fundulus heteroclitus TaxID=8078 RepID=UPI00165B7553|nr:C-C motif chemokine 4-like [Fundulus heteroclitus]
MVMMKSPVTLATCLLLLSFLVLQTQANFGPDECCFKFVPKLPKRGVVSFRYTDSLCPMKGVLFTMKNGKEYCADPDQDWAKEIIKSKEKNQTKGVRDSTTTTTTVFQ